MEQTLTVEFNFADGQEAWIETDITRHIIGRNAQGDVMRLFKADGIYYDFYLDGVSSVDIT